jgi:hypothetical protein
MDVPDAMRLTEKLYRRLDARRPEVEKFEDYYEGKQPLTFATEEWRAQNAARYVGFSDNWCAPIVNAEAERASIGGISFFGTKTRAKQAWDTLRRNRFELQFSQSVIAMLSAKRAFGIVWGDSSEKPVVTFEHPSMVEVQYDWENPQERVAALKSWVDEDTEFATLYTRDQVFKFKRPRIAPIDGQSSQADQSKPSRGEYGGWEPRFLDDSDYVLGNPLGVVPVVEFQNRPLLRGNPQSEIQGAVPMQDSINLLWAYLMLAADYASMDARVMLSADPPKIPILDKEGNIIGHRPVEMKDLRERRLINITGENARIDAWEAAKLDIFTDTIEIAVGHIAAQTRTPPHYLVANKGLSQLSGEALQASEAGLVTKVREFKAFTDDSLREMLRLMALVEGDVKGADAAPLAQFHWDRIEVRSDAQTSDAMSKDRSTGYPFEYLLEKYGHSPSDIERIMEMKRREDAEALGLGVQSAVQDAVADERTE